MKINRILLVVPPVLTLKEFRDITPLPPMGLGYLASVSENLGLETKIIDFILRDFDNKEEVSPGIVRVGSCDQEIEAQIVQFNPDLIGVSCQFSRENEIYQDLFRLIKRIKPGCVTVAGGAHATVCPRVILENPCCDYVLIGEAERSFEDLLNALNKDSDVHLIDGIGYKDSGKLYINEKKEWISDLDSIIFPAYHLMNLKDYFGISFSHGKRHKNRFCPIITSRGCPARCTFCSAKKVWGNKYRMRTVKNVLIEMRKLKTEYGIEEIMFEDDNVTANPYRAKELFLGMIEENLGFVWDTPNGVGLWSVDETMLDLMKDSGCVRLSFPVESGSQDVIDNVIKKPIKLSKIKNLLAYCRKIKLDYNIFLVIGMPGEKIKDIWKSFYFSADNNCFMPNISIATPYPGTDLFEQCSKESLFTSEFSYRDLFIRSFMIKTKDWNPKKLKSVLFWGELYLKFRWLISEPISFIKYFISYVKKPKRLVGYFSKYVEFNKRCKIGDSKLYGK